MKKIRLEKRRNGLYKITWPKKGGEVKEIVVEKTQERVDNFETEPKMIKGILVKTDKSDDSCQVVGDREVSKKKNIEEP